MHILILCLHRYSSDVKHVHAFYISASLTVCHCLVTIFGNVLLQSSNTKRNDQLDFLVFV